VDLDAAGAMGIGLVRRATGGERHSPRGARARGHLQCHRGGLGDFGGRRRPPRDLPLDWSSPGVRAPRPSAPRRPWCRCSRRILGACRPSASRAPAPTSSRWRGSRWWAAPSAGRGAGFLQHGAVMLGADPARLRRVFPGAGSPRRA
jgi:hypothetical protein